MKQLIPALVLFVSSSPAMSAQVRTFDNFADFQALNPGATLIEDFEDSDPALRDVTLPGYSGPGGEIAFSPVSSYPFPANLVIASPGVHPFAPELNPTTSIILSVTGNEDFVGTLASPAYALGFDIYLNDFPATLSFFNGTTLLATLAFDDPPEAGNNIAFAGITSAEGVTGFRWTATNGQYINTGLDNVYLGTSAVPEPSTWAMMLMGFAFVGFAGRRAKRTASVEVG